MCSKIFVFPFMRTRAKIMIGILLMPCHSTTLWCFLLSLSNHFLNSIISIFEAFPFLHYSVPCPDLNNSCPPFWSQTYIGTRKLRIDISHNCVVWVSFYVGVRCILRRHAFRPNGASDDFTDLYDRFAPLAPFVLPALFAPDRPTESVGRSCDAAFRFGWGRIKLSITHIATAPS